jgi:hypothetical protein
MRAIAAEYAEMNRRKMNEDEFASYAKECLFKRIPRADDILADGLLRIDRMVNLVVPPKPDEHWLAPPCLDGYTGSWSWDVRADCSYWISLRGFNPSYQQDVQGATYAKNNDGITCPYLTIEFKRDDDDVYNHNAQNQVAASGSIALYNRFLLWRKATQICEGDSLLPKTSDTDIRHYGITAQGSSFMFWLLRPRVGPEGEWAGCTMERLGDRYCTAVEGTKSVCEWINEIHRWGLTVHGPACKNEIKICLDAEGVETSGFDTSSMGLEECRSNY